MNQQDFNDWDQINLEDQWSKDADSIFDIEDSDVPELDDEGFIIIELE
jgi:hypothetical protein